MARKKVTEQVRLSFVPLRESAISGDGRVAVKIIQPGWGSSAYYPAEVLRRDGPAVFGEGTKMFWNHATPTEESERPEGDLNNYVGRLVTGATWNDRGPLGPGLYAEAEVFESYRGQVEEKRPELSIRAFGRAVTGAAEGRQGRIVQELLAARSVDWVTEGGAGGQIVALTEAARSATVELREAHNLAEWLESRLHLALTTIADDLFGEGMVNRDERKALSGAIGQALDAYHEALLSSAPQLFERGRWQDAPEMDIVSESRRLIFGSAPAISKPTEDMTMAQKDEAPAGAIDTEALQAELAESRRALAKAQELLLLREAADFVAGKLATTDLPELTRQRLARNLAANPPVKEGRIDEAVFGERIEAAVKEAAAEVAAIAGSGRIVGMGGGGAVPANGNLQEAEKRMAAAMADMGYGRMPVAATGKVKE